MFEPVLHGKPVGGWPGSIEVIVMARSKRHGISDVRKNLVLRAIEALPVDPPPTPQDISLMTVFLIGYDGEAGLTKLQRGIGAGAINKAILEDSELLAMAQAGQIAAKLRTEKAKDPEWVERVDADALVRVAPGSAIEAGRALFLRNVDDIQDPKVRAARIALVDGLISSLTATPLTRGIHLVKLNTAEAALAINVDRLQLEVTKRDRQIDNMLAASENTQRLLQSYLGRTPPPAARERPAARH
jgi:hypothetical protein